MSNINNNLKADLNSPKYKILALFGKSGAGKDTIQKWLIEKFPNWNGIVSCTTRPKREYERDGIDYHFLEPDEFAEKVLNGSMLEATSFNDWFYGTSIDELKENTINVGVFNIEGVSCLLEDSRLEILPVYIQCYDRERLYRNLKREKNPNCLEICRRFLTDEKDFSNIPFDFIPYANVYNKEIRFDGIINVPEIKDFIYNN